MRASTLPACAAVVSLLAAWPSAASDPVAPPIPALPIAIGVAVEDGPEGPVPVQDEAWIEAQLAAVSRLFSPEGVHFQRRATSALAPRFARLETRDDRDALGSEVQKGFINVFVVASLRDVDDPSLHRMGVHWRARKNLARHYVIVAASAAPTTLAHELGHFFGNGHSPVADNLMSYRRTGQSVFLDAAQVKRIRASARGYLARKELVPLAPP